jgi:hypothetical protein
MNKISITSIDEESGVVLQDSFPVLLSLDLSFNYVIGLSDLLMYLSEVKTLRMLGLEGNPLCMLRGWKNMVEEELRELQVLDLVDLKEDDDADFDLKTDTFQALMSSMWGETWAEDAAAQREEENKEATKGGGKGKKKKDTKKGKGKKGAKKEDPKAKKGKAKVEKEPERKSTAKQTGSGGNQETIDNNSSRISANNLISSSMVFEGKAKKDFSRYLNLKFEIKTLENLKPIYLEELETEENKEDLDKLQ